MRKKITRIFKIIFLATAAYLALVYLVALLPREKLIGNRCLPPELQNKKHTDYFAPILREIPLAVTAFCSDEPPIMIAGNQTFFERSGSGSCGPKPIPRPGEWQFSLTRIRKGWPFFLAYFAITTEGGIHFRVGCRWDDVNHYYVFPSLKISKNPLVRVF